MALGAVSSKGLPWSTGGEGKVGEKVWSPCEDGVSLPKVKGVPCSKARVGGVLGPGPVYGRTCRGVAGEIEVGAGEASLS